ncbi:hypothetical protein EDF38_0044 [Frigoribacterium sp. PhB160]|uniref:hypothetical protein n=1 Tax=Frigoribacterium sp. PhB160 TaxID=2485192 RepID=UPI000F493AA6|nr:hypothetical protein [Frigoribacterium sp. PhB160]ROS60968.1 hypothetical protein EDF38_0044 [Frigoribacterium sp. PhB160]
MTNDTLLYTVALNGYGTSYRRAIRSQEAYARRLGAEHVSVTKPFVKDPALAAWLKVPLLASALASPRKWVAYIDADCVVSEQAPDFRESITSGTVDVHMAEGRSGRVNSGVIFARNSEASRGYIDRVLATLTESVSLEDRAGLKYENGNFIYVDRTVSRADRLPLEWNNTFDPDLVDHIRHYTGDLRAGYQRSVLDTYLGKAQKIFARKPGPQPERRSREFVAALDDVTRRAIRLYPTIG